MRKKHTPTLFPFSLPWANSIGDVTAVYDVTRKAVAQKKTVQYNKYTTNTVSITHTHTHTHTHTLTHTHTEEREREREDRGWEKMIEDREWQRGGKMRDGWKRDR